MRVDFSFPTGNGVVAASANGLVLDRDLRDSSGDRWYWHARLTAEQDGTAHIRLARPGLIGRYGPAVRSSDEYDWLWPSIGSDDAFRVPLTAGATVHVSATLPYGPRELAAFRSRTANALNWAALTSSEGGRPVPIAAVRTAGARRSIVLTARHHACEAMASFVLEGAVSAFLAARQRGDATASGCDLLAVPFVDVDGVHRGDQGKARLPWDHNRDYGPVSRYRAVSALRAALNAELRPIYALDLHTPGLRGDIEERPYVVASGDPGDVDTATELLARLNAEDPRRADGAAELLLFDHEWNSRLSIGQRCAAAWLRSLPGCRVATTIEYPNAVDYDRPIRAADARNFGAALLRSLLNMIE